MKRNRTSRLTPSAPGSGGYGWGWGGAPITTDVRARDILVGTLTIDVVDAKRNQLAWRGLGSKRVYTDDARRIARSRRQSRRQDHEGTRPGSTTNDRRGANW